MNSKGKIERKNKRLQLKIETDLRFAVTNQDLDALVNIIKNYKNN